MRKAECHLSGLPQAWLISALGQGKGWQKDGPSGHLPPLRALAQLQVTAPIRLALPGSITTGCNSAFFPFQTIFLCSKTQSIFLLYQKYCDGINNNFIPKTLVLFTSHNCNSRKVEKNVDITACFLLLLGFF